MSDEFLENCGGKTAVCRVTDPMEILDFEGACDYLHLSRTFVYKLLNEKSIPCSRIGKRIFFVKADLFHWAQGLRVKQDENLEDGQ